MFFTSLVSYDKNITELQKKQKKILQWSTEFHQFINIFSFNLI